MGEEMSMISSSSTNVCGQASDSNNCNHPFHNKCSRHDSNIAASKFEGVVSQLNGHWGAQMYAIHQQIWLGMFESEKEAAMAYDSAATKLQNGDSHKNFPCTNITAQEPKFQNEFSTEPVLNTTKDGSYASRLLFQKELSPSDVGKLNRLVIPKRYALKYFPNISDGAEKNEAGGGVDDMQLVFYDRSMRSWKFHYCYWKSSQSLVFTKGWKRFVKANELKAKDTVIFCVCECKDGSNEAQSFFMIDVCSYVGVESNSGVVKDINNDSEALHLGLQKDIVYVDDEVDFQGDELQQLDHGQNSNDNEDEKESEGEKKLVGAEITKAEKKGLWLFGVQIT
ncbi:unnamed protein product [Ilex paraguariensis]|uniref:AP2/ERF and B3 domain-containing transcription factor n=1 Tax=Ilex paraguariensis TaxID=185542 RepID=A0ABC8QZA6_9AQUA